MSKRFNMVLEDGNVEDLKVIKQNTGVVSASQAARWALHFAAEHFRAHPSAVVPADRPATPKFATRAAPKPGKEPQYVNDEE
jgi:hypothetical protein